MGDRSEGEPKTAEAADRQTSPQELERRAEQAKSDGDFAGWFEAKAQAGESLRRAAGDPLDRATRLDELSLAELAATDRALGGDIAGRLDPEKRNQIAARRDEIGQLIADKVDRLRRATAKEDAHPRAPSELAELSPDDRRVAARVAVAEAIVSTGAERASWHQLLDKLGADDARSAQHGRGLRPILDQDRLRLHHNADRALEKRTRHPRR